MLFSSTWREDEIGRDRQKMREIDEGKKNI